MCEAGKPPQDTPCPMGNSASVLALSLAAGFVAVLATIRINI